jgi:hypothetical protein
MLFTNSLTFIIDCPKNPMNNRKIILGVRLHYLLTAASMLSLSQLIYSIPMDAVGQLDRYWVVLKGDQQIQPVDTDAMGFVGLKFEDDFTKLLYNVNVHNIDKVTGVYIYLKNENQNASVVLDLLKKTRESNREDDRVSGVTQEGQTTGTISIGGVTKEDLSGSLKGKSLSDLYKLMVDGLLYVIVHTNDFPSGEIRGDSFVGMDDVFHGADEFNWN